MVKQQWRKRTHGTPRQKGKAFILGSSQAKLKSQLPRISGRPSTIHDTARRDEIQKFLTTSLMHAKSTPDEYAKYVEGSLHTHKDIQVKVPSHKVDLSLKVVNIADLPPVDGRRKDFEASVQHIMKMYRNGETIPPILIHQKLDGSWSILDGNARVAAYRRLGIVHVPAVENSIGETLSHIGKYLGHSFNIARGYAGRTARFLGKASRFAERQTEKLGKAVGTPSRLKQAYERGRYGEPEPEKPPEIPTRRVIIEKHITREPTEAEKKRLANLAKARAAKKDKDKKDKEDFEKWQRENIKVASR